MGMIQVEKRPDGVAMISDVLNAPDIARHVRALSRRRRAVMLFPLKSLAEEKYRLFEKTNGPLGVKCLIVTGDHPENDKRFASGDYHIALAIHEKFDLALTNRLDLLQNIGLIVIPGMHMFE